MSLFAVLRPRNSDAPRVIDCHINVWSLGGLLGYRPTILDVGLRLAAEPNQSVSEFELALPFGTENGSLSDLRSKLTSHELLDLVFSGNATLTTVGGQSINYDGTPLQLVGVDVSSSKKLSAHSDKQSCVWLIKPNSPIVHGTEVYLRLRFEVDRLGRTWVWRRSLLAKNGALVDFRVGDARGTDAAQRDIDPARFIKIARLYLFIVAPAWLELRTASPQLHYIRLLEGKPWWQYLGRATNTIRDEKLAIYQWRAKEIGDDRKSFHAFLDLRRHIPIPTVSDFARAVIPIVVIGFLAALVLTQQAEIVGFVQMHVLSLGIGATFMLLVTALKDWKYIRLMICMVRNGFRRVANLALKVRMALSVRST